MFVTIVFDTEYMGMDERHKWFLKNLSHAVSNEWLVITHEHLGQHYRSYAQNCQERFFHEFEMHRLCDKEYEQICKGFVPDKIFEKKEKELGSRTALLMYLFQERYLELEEYLIKIVDTEISKRPGEQVEGIFNCLDCFASIRYLGDYYHCPVIPYVFSAIRKVHGYQQTLYMTSMDGTLYSCENGRKRYEKFRREKQDQLIFSRRELLTIFGKEQNIPLLKLLDCEPQYEMGICASAWDVNHNFLRFQYTDDDIYYECKKAYPPEAITTRMHPLVYDKLGMGREHLRNDPVPFFLSCRRITSVQSQMLLKAMLWNRSVYIKGDFLQFSFLGEKEVNSTLKVEIDALNYYILGFLVPSELMFDINYWRWRIEKDPTEHEIYERHLSFYCNCLGLDKEVLKSKETERFPYLLGKRNCSKLLIADLMEGGSVPYLNYEVLYSKLTMGRDKKAEYNLNRINQCRHGKVHSQFVIDIENEVDFLRFYPFVDVGGKAKVNSISINGQVIYANTAFAYFPKVDGFVECKGVGLFPQRHIIDVEWEYQLQ